ncbi:YchE family NAAT transporter [Basfia succiniciproducens]|uniref:YchE family NAAT transporter n=1 Tax=Basfia succiniciproducens TaxID=653940 RepID=UPI003FCCD992
MEFIQNSPIYAKFFLGLVAVINPFGVLPVFVNMTNHQPKAERNHTNLITSFSVGVILLVSLFFGKIILSLFSISINSFRIAGGILIISIAMTMISGKLGEDKQNKDEKNADFANMNSIAVVPLAMPILAGPGAISSTIVWASQYSSWFDWIGFSFAIILFSLLCYGLFRSGPTIVNALGKTGSNVVTRIMGLILMSLGIESIVVGITKLFPGLIH